MRSVHEENKAIRDWLLGEQPASPLPAVSQSEYGCHCDLEPGMKPDACVIDLGRSDDCVHACMGKTKETCGYWQPIVLATRAASSERGEVAGSQGWRLVPDVPTEDMCMALLSGIEHYRLREEGDTQVLGLARSRYADMLAASPECKG